MLTFRFLDGAVVNPGFVVSDEGGKGVGGNVRLKKTRNSEDKVTVFRYRKQNQFRRNQKEKPLSIFLLVTKEI